MTLCDWQDVITYSKLLTRFCLLYAFPWPFGPLLFLLLRLRLYTHDAVLCVGASIKSETVDSKRRSGLLRALFLKHTKRSVSTPKVSQHGQVSWMRIALGRVARTGKRCPFFFFFLSFFLSFFFFFFFFFFFTAVVLASRVRPFCRSLTRSGFPLLA